MLEAFRIAFNSCLIFINSFFHSLASVFTTRYRLLTTKLSSHMYHVVCPTAHQLSNISKQVYMDAFLFNTGCFEN